jgi:hypothetical protein
MTRKDRRAYSVLPFPPLTLTAPMLIAFLPWPLLLLDAVIILNTRLMFNILPTFLFRVTNV